MRVERNGVPNHDTGEKMAFKLSELTLLESQIGFVAGIIVGALGSWVYLVFFTNIDWWVKVLACIGEIGIIGSLGLSLRQSILARRNYLEMQKQMKEMENNMNKEIYTAVDDTAVMQNVLMKSKIFPSEEDMKGGYDGGKKTI